MKKATRQDLQALATQTVLSKLSKDQRERYLKELESLNAEIDRATRPTEGSR